MGLNPFIFFPSCSANCPVGMANYIVSPQPQPVAGLCTGLSRAYGSVSFANTLSLRSSKPILPGPTHLSLLGGRQSNFLNYFN